MPLSLIMEEKRKEITSLEAFKNAIENHPTEELEDWFDKLATCLMNYLVLQVGENSYRIVECEIYYNDKNRIDGKKSIHPDPYVHGEDQQLTYGKLYLNKVGGLDITFGSEKQKIYGGILIRGIRKLFTEEYTSQVTKITGQFFAGLGTILEETKPTRLHNVKKGYHEEGLTKIPVKSIRIGLRKREDDIEDFIGRNYRYIVELNKNHKFKNKENVVRELVNSEKIKKGQIKEILDYQLKDI